MAPLRARAPDAGPVDAGVEPEPCAQSRVGARVCREAERACSSRACAEEEAECARVSVEIERDCLVPLLDGCLPKVRCAEVLCTRDRCEIPHQACLLGARGAPEISVCQTTRAKCVEACEDRGAGVCA